MPARLLVLLFLLVLGWESAMAADLQRAKELNREGEKLLAKAKYQEATKVFRSMMDSCGDHEYCKGIATFYLGRCFFEVAEYDKAMEYLTDAENLFTRIDRPVEKAKVLQEEGRVYAARTDYVRALHYYDSAARDLARVGRKEEASLFWVVMNRAEANIRLYRYDDAAKDLKQAGDLLRGRSDPKRTATLLERKALMHFQKQEFAEAEKACREALGIHRQHENLKGAAAMLNMIGQIRESQGEYRQARESYLEALDLSKQFGDPSSQAFAYNNLGSVNWKRGNYSEALKMYNAALEIRRRLGIKRFIANQLNNIGLIYLVYGDYPKSMQFFNESRTIAHEVEAKEVEAWALHDMAWVFKEQGKFREALQRSKQAIGIAEEIKNRRLEATARLRLGNLYEYYGSFEEALKCYDTAVRIQREIGDRLFESNTLIDLANTRTRRGGTDNLRQAEKMYGDAIKIKRRIEAPLGESLSRFALFFLERHRYRAGTGSDKDRQNDLRQAKRFLQEAERAIKPDDAEGLMLLTYVKSRYLLDADPAASIAEFQGLKKRADSAGSLKYAFLSWVGLGLAYENLGRLQDAEKAFEKAVEAAEGIRNTLDPESRRTFLHGEEVLGVKHVLPYEGLARVRMLMGKKEGSWEASEYTKARSFAERIAQRVEGASFGVQKDLLDRLTLAEQQIASAQRQLQKCRAREGDRSAVPELERKKEDLTKTHTDLEKTIKLKYPKFYEVRFPHPTPIAKAAFRPNEWTLAYEITDTGILVFLIEGKAIRKATFTPVPREELYALIRHFREPLDMRPEDSMIEKLKSFNFRAGRKIADLLLGEVLPELPQDVPVTILPDELLGIVPFEALPVSAGGEIRTDRQIPYIVGAQFFGDRNPISYYQSGTALTWARTWGMKGKAGAKLLAMVDPVFSTDDPRAKAVAGEKKRTGLAALPEILLMSIRSETDLQFPRLGVTRQLGDFLKRVYGDATDLYQGMAATKTLLMEKDLGTYQSIVFGTHGYAEDDLPWLQEPVIVLTLVDQPTDRDGFLRMSEVMSLKMNPELVALTACQTGLGKNISGEGTMSMGRAFQYSGARAVLMSLWSVHEEASVKLMESFFSHIRSGESTLQALRVSRSEIRKDQYDHPFFWASFILVGEAGPR